MDWTTELDEQLASQFETWDQVRDRAAVHLPGDTPFGCVAVSVFSFPQAQKNCGPAAHNSQAA